MKTKIKFTIALITLIFGLYLMSMTYALTVSSVSVSPDSIAPGETSDVIMSVKNNGDNDITDVSVSLDFTGIPLAPGSTGSSFGISTLDSGKTKSAEFNLIAQNDAASGIYKIPVDIKYTENDITKTTQSMISIMINSIPVVDVTVDDGTLLKAKDNKLTVRIINKGLADVKFSEIEVGDSTYYNVLSQQKIYIGDVDSNDFQTADVSIYFKDNAPSTVTIPITLRYKDVTNKEYTQDSSVSVRVYTTQEAQNLGLVSKSYASYYIGIVIVVILIFVLYRLIRSRRKQEE